MSIGPTLLCPAPSLMQLGGCKLSIHFVVLEASIVLRACSPCGSAIIFIFSVWYLLSALEKYFVLFYGDQNHQLSELFYEQKLNHNGHANICNAENYT